MVKSFTDTIGSEWRCPIVLELSSLLRLSLLTQFGLCIAYYRFAKIKHCFLREQHRPGIYVYMQPKNKLTEEHHPPVRTVVVQFWYDRFLV